MTPEVFADIIQKTCADNLCAVALYGSAVTGDHAGRRSDINLLIVLNKLGLPELQALTRPIARWQRAGHPPPMLFTRAQLAASADIFPIELLDIREHHRLLLGADLFSTLEISRHHLRLQLEHEWAGKLIHLRQSYLACGGRERALRQLMLNSVSSFATLLRAVLRLFATEVPAQKMSALRALTAHLPFNAAPFEKVYDLKHGRIKPRELDITALFAEYLETVEQLQTQIDQLESKVK